MKLNQITSICVSFLFFVACGLTITEGAGFCLAKPLHDLASKHEELYKWLYEIQTSAKERILTKKRWKDKDFPLGEAQADLQASVAKAHDICSVNGGLGVETTKAQAAVFAGDSVADSTKTSLEDAGAGIGHIVNDSGLPDAEVAAVINHINDTTIPAKTIFKDMEITVAEVTDSVRVLREANVPIPPDYWGSGKIRQPGPPPNNPNLNVDSGSGATAELLIAAKDIRNGGNISGFDYDRVGGGFEGTKIDYLLDNDKMVQVGLSLSTIENKFDDSMAAAIATARFQHPNRKFIFKYLDKDGKKPSQLTIEALNARMGSPANWLALDNFQPVAAIP